MKLNCNPRNRRPRRLARGMSLAEVLVAMTVFVIAAAVALILYNALSQSYKRGDNAADVQQNTRMAFERLVTDTRMAGFNYNPDGNGDRPDEQFEGAWDTAITFRGDFDIDDPTASITPEAALAGGSENVVSTGNDEIVTYALAKPDGTGGQDLTFVADVQGVPRDGTTETVTISNLALVQNDPPYTLYRITVNDNSTAVTRTPVADNIYSLQFRYFDSGGTLLSPATFGDASDDIGGLETSTARDLRETVRRVELSIVGMTPDPDLKYVDSDDPYPTTEKHRKFTLAQDISPRNLGYVGRVDIDAIPPDAPENLAACAGQCQGVLLTWDAPDPTELVNQWVALRGPTISALGSPRTTKTNEIFMGGMTEGSGYYFRVRAEDLSGNVSPLSNLAGETIVGDTTTPESPTLLLTTGGSNAGGPAENDQINVRWPPVTTNVESVTCDPEPNKIRDLRGYKLYRSEAPNAFPGSLYKEIPADTSEIEEQQVVACRTYYYDITAVDNCDNESLAQGTDQLGMATTVDVPLQGSGIQATPGGATGVVDLAWDRIFQNTAGRDILVDTYRLYRAEAPSGMTASEALSAIDWAAALPIDAAVVDTNAPSFTDTTALASDPSNTFYYRVAGLTDCSAPYDEGALSDPNESATCNLGATIILEPRDGTSIAGAATVALGVNLPDPQQTYSGFLTISDAFGSIIASHGSGANPLPLPAVFLFETISLVAGDYIITGTVRNGSGCSSSVSHTVSVVTPVPCCIAPQNPVLGPARGQVSSRNRDVLIKIVNNCGEDLEITRMDVDWTNLLGFKRIQYLCWDTFGIQPKPDTCQANSTFTLEYIPPLISPVDNTFTPALDLSRLKDDLDPLYMGFQYDETLIDEDAGTGETINVQMSFTRASSSGETQCVFQIQTNPLDVVIIDPENP